MKKLFSLLLTAALVLAAPAAALAGGETPDYSGLVTDAYYVQYDFEGYPAEYHIPQINWDGAGVAALNAAIWADLYEGYMHEVSYASDHSSEGYWPVAVGISYSWTVSGDVLSILAVANCESDVNVYHVYNMSLSTGRQLSDPELFKAAGVTREQFNDLVRSALSASYDEFFQYVDSGVMEDTFLRVQRSRSVSGENIALARPYMGPGGSLCAVARWFAIAGADYYENTFTLIPGDMQEVLEYFIEHSDSEYFTREDIEGFDDEMCLYARNSIYAKLGWKFEMPELREYFSRFDWYSPTLDPSQFTAGMLNDCQRANVDLVLNYEAEHGY